jgi:hypothetical protein
MARKKKMGRPPVEEKGRVYGFYAPPELTRNIEEVLQYTGGTVSEYLRGLIESGTNADLEKYAAGKLSSSTLSQYTGGSIETQKGN